MNKSMNVVQVPRRFVKEEWGGTETVILQTSRNLVQKGIHTKILTSMALARTPEETIEEIEVKRFQHFYPFWGLSPENITKMDKKGGNLFSFALMKALLKEPQLDLIHLHTGKRLGGICRTVAQIRKIPYIISLHGGVFDVPVSELSDNVEAGIQAWEWGKILGWAVGSRRVIADADAVICVGKSEQIQAQKLYPDRRIEYIPNGVDFNKFASGNGSDFRKKHNIPIEATLFLSLSRIDPQKNQLFSVENFSEILKIVPDAVLLFIGPVTNQQYLDKIEQAVQQQGLQNKVKILAGIHASDADIVNAYHAADVFLLTSVHEPFGIVILEAWSAGKPVIASKVGGIPFFVENDVNGFLFENGNPATFIECIKKAFRDGKLSSQATQIATHGRREAAKYSWESITQSLISIYSDVCDKKKRGIIRV
ncbi:MAG: glycosyltransferase family 4 protein [Candidatus Riflebacteria bacterium]|nr:glycosyltransferase family 4 protein [Candidatus Riflebacteria bacterium]